MKRVLIGLFAAVVLLAGCAPQQGEEPPSMSSQAEAPAQMDGVLLDGFDTVGCHFEPGDFRYPFSLDAKQQEELQSLLQPDQWVEAAQEEGPQYGLSCVLTAKSEEYTLYVFPYSEKEKTILKLEPIDSLDDGSGAVCYFAPAQVGEDAKEFMKPFEEQASAQRGEDTKELMQPFEE